MKRFVLSAMTTMTATAALAANAVATIEVDADLSAIRNIEAAQVWSTLDTDLETEIAERLVGRIDDKGAAITVDINEVELANSFTQALGVADSKLIGDVEIDAPGLFNKIDYTLTVTSEQAIAYYPDGTSVADVSMGSEIYYQAMLNAFADNIAAKFD
jgi:hypothetical protein